MQIAITQFTADRYAIYGVKLGDVGEVVCIDRGCYVMKNDNWTTYVLQPMEKAIA